MIGKIAVSAANFAIDKPYSYWIPQDMALAPGQRVMVPFGRANRRTEGIVLTVEPGSEDKLKPVESCLDDGPILTRPSCGWRPSSGSGISVPFSMPFG